MRASILVVTMVVFEAWLPEASAQVMCDGRACPEGFTCETSTSTCAPEDTGCVPFTETYCKSPACEVDSDCPSGRRCRLSQYCDCAGGLLPDCTTTAPPPGSGGGSGDPPAECPLVTESWCDPAYQLPCETSEQCGAGFTCEPACDCSAPDPSEDCGICLDVEHGITGGCYTPVRSCTTVADCPTGWTCEDNENGFCNVVGDVHTGCNAGDPPRICLPPFLGVSVPAGNDTDGEGAMTSPPAAKPSAGGCSLVGNASNDARWVALVPFAVALAARRRRRRGLPT